jgi:hypothetical protein
MKDMHSSAHRPLFHVRKKCQVRINWSGNACQFCLLVFASGADLLPAVSKRYPTMSLEYQGMTARKLKTHGATEQERLSWPLTQQLSVAPFCYKSWWALARLEQLRRFQLRGSFLARCRAGAGPLAPFKIDLLKGASLSFGAT